MTDDLPALEVREITTVEGAHQAADLLDQVWPGEGATFPANILRALAHSGNYVVGVYDGDEMIGTAAAFFGPPASRTVHSHVTGVLPEYQGRGVGRALKNHQRQWAFAHDVGHITWTFDPLIARNAHFNLRVLGARVTDYLVNHYGDMNDDINRDDESDRVMVSWALAASAATPSEDRVLTNVPIPHDIETLRREDPFAAADWRFRVREEFLGLLQDGLVVGGFSDERGYLFTRG